MSRSYAVHSNGFVQSGHYDVVSRPLDIPASAQRPIIVAHGYNPGNVQASTQQFGTQAQIARIYDSLTKLGSVVVACDFGNNLWGNTASSAMVENARLKAVSLGARNDGCVIVGFSMGYLTGYGYGRDNAGKLKGLFGIAPASSLVDIYTNTRVNNASIAAAYGIAASGAAATSYASFDPTQTPGPVKGLPGHLFYGTADVTVQPATVTALATKLGVAATIIDTTNAHLTDGQLSGMPLDVLSSEVIALL